LFIVKNYLNKVAGSREIGKKVFFQGGVAHNQAVVNAFRSILGNELEVPPFFSVTGAYGVALLAKERRKESGSSFKGFALEAGTDFKETHQQERNKESVPTQIFKKTEEYYLEEYEKNLDSTKQTVGIPRVLFLHKLFPLFHTFFKELGFNVLLSDNSTERTVELSQEFAMEETCYPIKLINGHVAQLIEKKVDYIFLPSLHTMAHPISQTRQNYGCVYMQCFPKLIRQTMDLDSKGIKLLAPALSFEFGKTYMMKTLIKLGVSLKKNPIHTVLALKKGMENLNRFEQNVERLGDETIKGLSKDEKVFVIVTRAYGIADPILSMGIPEKIEKLGYKVLTLSNLPAHHHDTAKEYPNMYWPFGQHILSGAQIIKQHPNLYAIYLTNHGCGPDTALTHFFKEEMKGKPYLNIEVDEHFSSVGVLTRVEAFINSLNSEKVATQDNSWELKQYSEAVVHKDVNIQSQFAELDQETLWYLPHLYPYSQLLASYMQTKGYKAEVLPITTEKTLNFSRKYTLTKEYLSYSGLVGDVLSKALELKESLEAHERFGFMIPTSEGSEVGGQYHRLIRDKLDGENLHQTKIFAPYPEDVLKDSEMAPELILLLLAGDIINLAPQKKREKYLERIQGCIAGGSLHMKVLRDIAEEIRQELQGIQVLYAPLSETLWLGWRDYLNQKRHKSESTAHNQLKSLTERIKSIAELFTGVNPFEHNLVKLAQRADRELGLYSGGDGRYRQAKVLGTFKGIRGIITASSIYENTNTILNILSQNREKKSGLPILNLTFDGNRNEIDEAKIHSFIYYAFEEKMARKSEPRREA
jgi:predicted nucleotide-binding protein (sugar kinase/HSP70/actin superfamily)